MNDEIVLEEVDIHRIPFRDKGTIQMIFTAPASICQEYGIPVNSNMDASLVYIQIVCPIDSQNPEHAECSVSPVITDNREYTMRNWQDTTLPYELLGDMIESALDRIAADNIRDSLQQHAEQADIER